jgi:hypothetical protein
MYWERDGYVICQKVMESERSGKWGSEFTAPHIFTGAAWDLAKEDTLSYDGGYHEKYEDISFSEQ